MFGQTFELNDPFGPTISSATLQTLVGSEETRAGCELANRKRAEANLPLLELVVVGLILPPRSLAAAAVDGKMSSTLLRGFAQEKSAT